MSARAPIKVMLVDDNEIVRKGLQEAIEHSDDFTVVGETAEGDGALELVRELGPDVILLDVLMPGKDGIQVCREIVAAMPEAKVMMLSAFTDRSARNNALAAGALGYLPKLWSRDQLLDTLRAVVEGRYRPPGPAAVGKGRGGLFGR